MSANLILILIATVGLTIIARSEGSLPQSEIAPIGSQKADALVTDVLAKPRRYFNDYASLIDPKTAQQLDKRLEDFERQTSNADRCPPVSNAKRCFVFGRTSGRVQ